ncbi:hypothetical protein C6376_14760 [Streptomyces sp. P3]|uniref:hypothetical protein n=1 Tax=Streptomyces sp. P3 TaxID=2135430 RepID=UPI000D1A7555|nr:hypothetical protein [Streptomyces sp. P3]AVV42498.1 hypothetical protein C6376_14760 [Streptomyces sp. P3]
MGAVAVGCAGGAGDTADAVDTRSADRLLGEADRTMKALTSVTVVREVTTARNRHSSRLTTDLKSRCRVKSTASSGSEMEQIRIGGTDYIRGNDVYFELWGRETVPAMRLKPWLKSPVSAAKGADLLADCAWRFLPSSSGKATRDDPTELDGVQVIPVEVADGEVEGGVFTYYVAAEGKPYLLRVDYKERHSRRVTKFSAFNDRVDIQPPPAADVLDLSSLPPDGAR